MLGKICIKCSIELRCQHNGAVAVAMGVNGPQEMYSADIFACPECGHQTIIGCGQRPLARHFDLDFQQRLEAHRKAGDPIIEFWVNRNEKLTYANWAKKV